MNFKEIGEGESEGGSRRYIWGIYGTVGKAADGGS